MDSGNNSGSMQSSSGGADGQEFHSRGAGSDSISSFLNHNTFGTTPSQFLTVHNQNLTFCNQTLDQNHHSFPQPPNHYNNPFNDHLIWSSSGLRSEHDYTNFTNITPPNSTTQGPSPSVRQQRMELEAHGSRPVSDQLIKNPKKRTRASRRAPTTVLTTDTTNFRQMVQEFTGIPAVPFSGLLYPLRPAARKFIMPFSSSSHSQMLLNSAMLDSTNSNNNDAICGASTSNNFTDHLSNLEQHQNILLHSFGNLSGFPSQETTRVESGRVRNNNSNDEVQGSLVRFDGNGNCGGGGDQCVQQQLNVSGGGYNLNVSKKVLENVANSWICPSD